VFGLALYYIAFLDLTSTRHPGGPISWFSIEQYADRKQLDDEQREDLHFYIGRMDKTFLDFHDKKSEVKKPPKGKGRKG
jgi:hypothetical protein